MYVPGCHACIIPREERKCNGFAGFLFGKKYFGVIRGDYLFIIIWGVMFFLLLDGGGEGVLLIFFFVLRTAVVCWHGVFVDLDFLSPDSGGEILWS